MQVLDSYSPVLSQKINDSYSPVAKQAPDTFSLYYRWLTSISSFKQDLEQTLPSSATLHAEVDQLLLRTMEHVQNIMNIINEFQQTAKSPSFRLLELTAIQPSTPACLEKHYTFEIVCPASSLRLQVLPVSCDLDTISENEEQTHSLQAEEEGNNQYLTQAKDHLKSLTHSTLDSNPSFTS